MSFWKRFFGRRGTEPSSQASGKVNPQSGLHETFTSIRPDGPSLYGKDRDQAFHWYRQQEFPSQNHKTELGAAWFATMSLHADDNSIWQEAWAGYHHALAGYVDLGMPGEAPDILWRLGRAHTGLENYELAHLYLESARRLSEEQSKTELNIRVMLEKAVLAVLSENPGTYAETMDRLSPVLFPSGDPSSLASEAALTLFREGKKNQEWRRHGQPVKASQIHARGFYEVSLDLNRRLDDLRAIGINLINLGDIWKELGQKGKAQRCWQESLQCFEALQDDQHVRFVQDRLTST